jgi:hypothetical protein
MEKKEDKGIILRLTGAEKGKLVEKQGRKAEDLR